MLKVQNTGNINLLSDNEKVTVKGEQNLELCLVFIKL